MHFLKNFFKSQSAPLSKNKRIKIKKGKQWIKSLKKISELSSELNKTSEALEKEELSVALDNASELYISLADVIKILTESDITLHSFLNKSKHIAELSDMKVHSVIEVYPVIEDDHVVLCPDVHECEKHSTYTGDPINIVTIRR